MFIRNLEVLCKKRGISMSKLATLIGKSTAAAAYWKNGSIPHQSTLQAIADFFDVPVEALLDESLITVGNVSPPESRTPIPATVTIPADILSMLVSQQKTIETQAATIKTLTEKIEQQETYGEFLPLKK